MSSLAFLEDYGQKIPKTTARRLKSEYLLKLNAIIKKSKDEDIDPVPQVLVLLKMTQGRPLLGNELDRSVQSFVESMRKVGGVVNTAIVMAAARV